MRVKITFLLYIQEIKFDEKKGQVVLDQLTTIDKQRLIKKLGNLSKQETKKVLSLLEEMFTY